MASVQNGTVEPKEETDVTTTTTAETTTETTTEPAPATEAKPENNKNIKDDLIVPPPDLRSIVLVTVDYVIRNGMNFEGELRKRQQNNRKFDFLIPGNPYYKWYKWKLQCKLDPKAAEQQKQMEEQEKKEQEEMIAEKRKEKDLAQKAVKVVELSLPQKIEQDLKIFRKVKEDFKKPPPENKCCVPLPPMVTPFEVDLIKLTAQFVARNGRQFLTALTSNHQMNPKFHFLKPIDPRFNYFQKLVTAYCECIVLHKDLIRDLEKDLDSDFLFQQAAGHAAYAIESDNQRKQNEADEAAVAMAMKLIDWHEFAIVETITFDTENEYYPAPGKNVEEINELLDTENRKEISVVLAEDVPSDMEVDMDVDAGMDDSDEEEIVEVPGEDQVRQLPGEKQAEAPPAAAPKPYGADTIVTADLGQAITLETPEDRQLREQLEKEVFGLGGAANAKAGYTTCPVTGQQVETNRLSEHIRIALLDPKWRQQKESLLQRMKVTSLAQGTDIVTNLSTFSAKHAEQYRPEPAAGQSAQHQQVDAERLKQATEQARLRQAAAQQGGEPPMKRRRM